MLLATALILLLTSCASPSGLKTSDGAGNISGLPEFTLGTPQSSVNTAGWERSGSGYMQHRQVTIGGQPQDCTISLDFVDGKLWKIALGVLAQDGAAVQKTLLAGLKSEYGSVGTADNGGSEVKKGNRTVDLSMIMGHPLLEVVDSP
jgi:hypothetical protein